MSVVSVSLALCLFFIWAVVFMWSDCPLQTPRIIEAKTDVRVTNESSQSAVAETSVETESSTDGKARFLSI